MLQTAWRGTCAAGAPPLCSRSMLSPELFSSVYELEITTAELVNKVYPQKQIFGPMQFDRRQTKIFFDLFCSVLVMERAFALSYVRSSTSASPRWILLTFLRQSLPKLPRLHSNLGSSSFSPPRTLGLRLAHHAYQAFTVFMAW